MAALLLQARDRRGDRLSPLLPACSARGRRGRLPADRGGRCTDESMSQITARTYATKEQSVGGDTQQGAIAYMPSCVCSARRGARRCMQHAWGTAGPKLLTNPRHRPRPALPARRGACERGGGDASGMHSGPTPPHHLHPTLHCPLPTNKAAGGWWRVQDAARPLLLAGAAAAAADREPALGTAARPPARNAPPSPSSPGHPGVWTA